MSDRKAETPRVAARLDTVLMGQERDRREIVELLIDEVMPNRRQPRQSFNPDSLEELAGSIRLHGVLEPVIVRAIPLALYENSGRQYELIAGERRWRAARLAERQTIPALVLPEATSDQAVLELAIIENLQREDLHPLDEATAYGRMQSELGYSYSQIAERVGKSKGYVQNRLRLLQLEADLRELVAERPDTLTHVYELAKISDRAQREPLVAAVRGEALSFVETRSRVQAMLSPVTEPEQTHLGAGVALASRDGSNEEGEAAYLRKYDDRAVDNRGPYLYKYDRERTGLTRPERRSLGNASLQIEQLLEDPGKLNAADWALVEKLAMQLAALLDAKSELS